MIEVSLKTKLLPVSIKDSSKLFNLMKSVYPPAYSHYWKDDCTWYLNHIYSEESLQNDLSDKASQYYFIYDEDHCVGIFKIILNCPYPPKSDKKGLKVHRLYLHPLLQGKGLGQTLMEYAEQVARAAKHSFVWLDAMDTHTQAQSFYKKLGYVKTDSQELDFPLLRNEHRKMWYMHKMIGLYE